MEAGEGLLVTSLSACGQHPGPQGCRRRRVASGLTAHEGQADHSQRLKEGQRTHPSVGKSKAQSKPPGTGLFRHRSLKRAFIKLNLQQLVQARPAHLPAPQEEGFWQMWRAHQSTQPGRGSPTPLKHPCHQVLLLGRTVCRLPPRDSTHPGTASEAPRPWRWNKKPQGRGHSSVTRPSEEEGKLC